MEGVILMNSLDELIQKLNFKKAAITYIVIAGVLLLLCLSIIVYVSRDKISMVIDYQKIADSFERNGLTDNVKNQLQQLAADSKDIKNVVVLDKNNTIVYKANNNLIEGKTKLLLRPYKAGGKYLEDSTNSDYLFKVVKPDDMILNRDYIDKDQAERENIDDELYYEKDYKSKDVYLLNYVMDHPTHSKVLMIRTVNPIPYAERLLEVLGTLLGLIVALYWIGLALWVYKDAAGKKLNASLWGLLVLITNLVGLIVFLIYKQNSLTCYQCGALQSKLNAFCSNCGTRVNESCNNCQAIISKGDNYCGRCGSKVD
jgi:RNA polymerase subunit RPABC4/transcription elongation factor Spt4